MKADRATNAGEQVFEDYGDNSNALYLDHHGFVPHAPNPFDCVSLTLSDEENGSAAQQQALTSNHGGTEGANDLLRKMRVPPTPTFCAPPPSPSPPSTSTATQSYNWGITAPTYVWLTAKSSLDATALATCHRLLQQRADAVKKGGSSSSTSGSGSDSSGATAVTAASVAAEVATGVCAVLTNGNPWAAFPPVGWAPSLDQVQSYLLPALHRRFAESPSSMAEDEAELALLMEAAATAEKEAATSATDLSAASPSASASAAALANDKVLALRYRIARKAHLRALLDYHNETNRGGSDDHQQAANMAVDTNSDGTVTPSAARTVVDKHVGSNSGGGGDDGRSRVWVNHSDCQGTTSEVRHERRLGDTTKNVSGKGKKSRRERLTS